MGPDLRGISNAGEIPSASPGHSWCFPGGHDAKDLGIDRFPTQTHLVGRGRFSEWAALIGKLAARRGRCVFCSEAHQTLARLTRLDRALTKIVLPIKTDSGHAAPRVNFS